METNVLFGPPPATLERLLGYSEFASLERVLSGLAPVQAAARWPGLPHSIAEIAAHLLSNLRFNLDLIEGRTPELRPTWPTAPEHAWPGLVSDVLAVNLRLQRCVHDPEVLERIIFPATNSEPGWTAGYKLAVNVGLHSAYHLGQIVTLRQLLGAWPAPA